MSHCGDAARAKIVKDLAKTGSFETRDGSGRVDLQWQPETGSFTAAVKGKIKTDKGEEEFQTALTGKAKSSIGSNGEDLQVKLDEGGTSAIPAH